MAWLLERKGGPEQESTLSLKELTSVKAISLESKCYTFCVNWSKWGQCNR